jgi:hypothetical protein
MAVVNVCRVEIVDELVPNVSVWVCTFEIAVLMLVTKDESWLLSKKEPAAEPLIDDRPSPDEL